MAPAKNTRARKARSVPHHAKRRPVSPDSAAGILSAVSRRLKFVMAAAFTVCAALEFQNAEIDAEFALVLGRCVGDEVDKQIEAIDRVIARLSGSRANAAAGKIRAIP
ncbi:MAG TPA: hypothetical protein VGS10_14005 [Terracidiphilus sp.]|nr:hypothetical protein [Terracidiphilus sp.]